MRTDRRPSPPYSAWVFAGVFNALISVALSATALVLLLSAHATLRDYDPTTIVLPLTMAVAGAFVIVRVPRNPIGWLLLSVALIVGVEALASAVVFRSLVTHEYPHVVGVWAEWLLNWLGALIFPSGLAAVAFLLLPTGRLPSPKWRPLLALAVVITTATVVGDVVAPGNMQNSSGVPPAANPTALHGWPILSSSEFVTWMWNIGLVFVLVAASAPFLRARRADLEERSQLKVIAIPIVVTSIIYAAVALGPGGVGTPGDGGAGFVIVILGYGLAFPFAIFVAVIKYRLYDVDVAINRAVTYALIAGTIVGLYVIVAVGVGSVLDSRSNIWLSLLATTVIAVLFPSIRTWAQRLANHAVYGSRATPYEELSKLSEKAAEAFPVENALVEMARIVAFAVPGRGACVWLRTELELTPAATWPEEGPRPGPVALDEVGSAMATGGELVPVHRGSELVGALSVVTTSTRPLAPIERRLLAQLASRAGLILENAGLNNNLRRTLEEVRASRQRLVRAEDQARRRIERDLHDGAQQHLLALAVLLGRAEAVANDSVVSSIETVRGLRQELERAIDSLRELAHGVYPPLLADRGLLAALSAHARRSVIPITVTGDGVARYERNVESAIYFCVLEAVQNSVKHSGANHVEVSLHGAGVSLTFTVTDNGVGFDSRESCAKGLGLVGMNDRVVAEGGTLIVESSPGHGTRVTGHFPASSWLATLREVGNSADA